MSVGFDMQKFFLLTLHFVEAKQSNSSAARCIEMEREAPLKFKGSLKDPSGWRCSNLTGHIVKLDLQSHDARDLVNEICLIPCGCLKICISKMRSLESLDLSYNHLVGSTPPSMSSLTSLSYLNLSYNNLSGQIPSTNQFLTFTGPSRYEGNPEFCESPLPSNSVKIQLTGETMLKVKTMTGMIFSGSM
eukprot:XP_025012397.1 systemin receptor SR160-like [Ricinus communis]